MKFNFDMTYKDEDVLLKYAMMYLNSLRPTGVFPIRISERYVKGYSDILVVVRGVFVAIELKDDTGTPSVHQKIFLEEVQKAGGIGGVCKTLGDIANLIGKAVIKSGENDKR